MSFLFSAVVGCVAHKILDCINKSDYDSLTLDRLNNFSTDDPDEDNFDHYHAKDPVLEHPCMAMKKLLSGGSFYYSADFDLTRRLQDR